MSGHQLQPGARTLLSREIDDLLLDLRGLALVQDLLTQRGASSGEIAAHGAELERRRRLLTDLLGGRDHEARVDAA